MPKFKLFACLTKSDRMSGSRKSNLSDPDQSQALAAHGILRGPPKSQAPKYWGLGNWIVGSQLWIPKTVFVYVSAAIMCGFYAAKPQRHEDLVRKRIVAVTKPSRALCFCMPSWPLTLACVSQLFPAPCPWMQPGTLWPRDAGRHSCRQQTSRTQIQR